MESRQRSSRVSNLRETARGGLEGSDQFAHSFQVSQYLTSIASEIVGAEDRLTALFRIQDSAAVSQSCADLDVREAAGTESSSSTRGGR